VGGIVGGVVAVVLLLAVVAALLIWRFKRADKAENNDVALKPANHYIPHAADFKVEEGPRYDSLSTGEAGATLPINDRGQPFRFCASQTQVDGRGIESVALIGAVGSFVKDWQRVLFGASRGVGD
jgi:hypothetical protein